MASVDFKYLDIIYSYVAEDKRSLEAYAATCKTNYLIHVINQGYIKGVELIKKSYEVSSPLNKKIDWITLKKAEVILLGEYHTEPEDLHLNTNFTELIWQDGIYSCLYESNDQLGLASNHIKQQSRKWDFNYHHDNYNIHLLETVFVAESAKLLLLASDEALWNFDVAYEKFYSRFSNHSPIEVIHLRHFKEIVDFISKVNLPPYEIDKNEMKLKISKTILLIEGFERLQRILQAARDHMTEIIQRTNHAREIKLVSEILINRAVGLKSIVIAGQAHTDPESTTVRELNNKNVDYLALAPRRTTRALAMKVPYGSTHSENIDRLKSYSYPDSRTHVYVASNLCKQVFLVELNLLSSQLKMLRDIYSTQFENTP